MKKNEFKHWINSVSSTLPITYTELVALGITTEEIGNGEARGELKTCGPWQLPVSFRALCMSREWGEYSSVTSAKAYGIRTLSAPRQEGYVLEGTVSVNGRKVRGFTSSQLFELPDGKLVNVATIHACIKNEQTETTQAQA
jgi:hypothetical protein